MKILAIETSYSEASVALKTESGETVVYADSARKHAETVLPAVQEALERAGCTLDELDYLAVDVGPGSFTGIRIGVCAANAFAYALHIPVVPVDSLSIIAFSSVRELKRPCIAMLDARNGNAYCAELSEEIPVPQIRVRSMEEVLRECADSAVLVGNAPLPDGSREIRRSVPNALDLVRFAWEHTGLSSESASARYIQQSGAERRRK